MKEEELKKQQAYIHSKIKSCKKKDNPKLKPIYDGVADIHAYLKSSPRIMWILKEPYGDFTETGKPKNNGLESFPDWFNKDNFWEEVNAHNKPFYRTISTVTFNIQNNKRKKQRDLSPEEIHNTIKQIAFINMSKFPGKKSTPSNKLESLYTDWEDILKEQRTIYKPNIIIFGNTFPYFKEVLGIKVKPIHRTSGKWSADKYEKDGMIYIDAYHPSRKNDDYVLSILKTIDKK